MLSRAPVELGFHAEVADPYCDGVTPIEELVEQVALAAQLEDEEERDSSGRRISSGRQPLRRWQGLARRFLPRTAGTLP